MSFLHPFAVLRVEFELLLDGSGAVRFNIVNRSDAGFKKAHLLAFGQKVLDKDRG